MGNNTIITNDTDIRLISISEACKRLGIGHCHMYTQIGKKAIKTVKIGKRRLVSTRALNEYITSLEH